MLLGSILLPVFARYPAAFFLLVDVPLFVLCCYMASKPVRERKMTAGHGILLIVVAPFAIWALLITGMFGAAILLTPS